MEIKVKIVDKSNIIINLKKYPKKFNDVVVKEIISIANEMRNYIIAGMRNTTPNFFRPIRRQGKGKNVRYHYPSLPGEFPAIDFGDLVRSINVVQEGKEIKVGSISMMGGKQLPYAKMLEEGTDIMLPRPYIKPTYDKFYPDVETRVTNVLKRVIKDTK